IDQDRSARRVALSRARRLFLQRASAAARAAIVRARRLGTSRQEDGNARLLPFTIHPGATGIAVVPGRDSRSRPLLGLDDRRPLRRTISLPRGSRFTRPAGPRLTPLTARLELRMIARQLLRCSMRFLTAIPVYNEERHLESVLNEVRRYSPHILVVNDGSTDHTVELLDRQHDV